MGTRVLIIAGWYQKAADGLRHEGPRRNAVSFVFQALTESERLTEILLVDTVDMLSIETPIKSLDQKAL